MRGLICLGAVRRQANFSVFKPRRRVETRKYDIRFAVAKEYACSFNEGFCGGNAWKSSIALNPRASGYSDIVFIDENTVGVVYERGTKSYFDEIVFSLVKIPR